MGGHFLSNLPYNIQELVLSNLHIFLLKQWKDIESIYFTHTTGYLKL